MAETRNSYLAEEPSKFEAHVVLSAYIPASMLDGQDAVPLLRRLLEQELPEKIKRNDGPEVEVRVLSIAPGSFVITFGVAFTIYKIVADYTKFKDGIRAIVRDAQALLSGAAGVPARVVVLFSRIPIASLAGLLRDAWCWCTENLVAIVAVIVLVVVPLINTFLLWRILHKLP